MTASQRPKQTVTVKDVAARAGVHPSTVSRALNVGIGRVSPELVSRVVAAAEELGYRPNRLARALRLERSSSVGMLIPDISNPVYAPIVRGVEDALRASGVSVLISSTDNDPVRESELVAVMLDRRVDGLLLATATRKYPLLDALMARKMPVVLINRSTDDQAVPVVRGDDDRGIQMAVEHLAGLGHRKMAHLAGTETVSTGYHRRRAFMRSLQEAGLPVEPAAIVSADLFDGPVGVALGAALGRELLRRKTQFTAVIAANDLLAIGCYDVFKDAGIRVPEDVSIVGYNDVPLVDRISPPLTTIRYPHYEIGARAGKAIIDCIDSGADEAISISLVPRLVVRGSTASPGRGTGAVEATDRRDRAGQS